MMLLVCASIVFNFQFSMFASAQAQSDSVVRVGLPGGPDIEMVWVEGGAFTMGSNGEKGVSHQYEDSRPEHRVTVGGYTLTMQGAIVPVPFIYKGDVLYGMETKAKADWIVPVPPVPPSVPG